MSNNHLRLVGDNYELKKPSPTKVDEGADGPNNGAVNERIAKLEQTSETIRAEMRANQAEIKAIVEGGSGQMRVELQTMRADIAKSAADAHKELSAQKSWVMTTALGTLALILSLVGMALAGLKDKPAQASQQQPIIIQMPAPQQIPMTQPVSLDTKPEPPKKP